MPEAGTLIIKTQDSTFFPIFGGLDKPSEPTQKVIKLKIKTPSSISKSPFYGVTRLSLVVGNKVSETFNNGRGYGQTEGRYSQKETTYIITFTPGVDAPKICWKVRNTYGIKKVVFELFAKGNPAPIWSQTWADAKSLPNLLKNSLIAGTKEEDGKQVPIKFSGSMDWNKNVVIKNNTDFPKQRLTAEKSPYQLRITVNDGNPGTDKMGYPLIAWTYIQVTQNADEVTEDDELLPLSLIILEKAGKAYTLDDGVNGASQGKVADDGVLIHPVSTRSEACVITFEDDPEPIELLIDRSSVEDADETREDWPEFDEEDEIEEELSDLSDDKDEEPVLSLILPGKENKSYTLNDGVNPASQGVVADDGLLVHPVSPQAKGCIIRFDDESEDIEIEFSDS